MAGVVGSRAMWGALPMAAALVVSACHTYRPVENPSPGATVRVTVPVVSAIADPNAPPQSVAIEGEVLDGRDTLVLAMTTRREFGAFRELTQTDTVRLAADQRLGVELREFSPRRSVVLGAVIAAGVTGLAAAAFGLGGGGDTDGPGDSGPNPAIVVSASVLSAIWSSLGGS